MTKHKCVVCGGARVSNVQYHEDLSKLLKPAHASKSDEHSVSNRDQFANNSSKYMRCENSHEMEMKFEHCAQKIITFNDNGYDAIMTLSSVGKKFLTKTELKYRKIDSENVHVVSKLLRYDGVIDYLKALGFEKQENGSALIVNKLNKPLIKH